MSGAASVAVALLSLILPLAAHDYYYRPTPRSPPRPHIHDAPTQNQFVNPVNASHANTRSVFDKLIPREETPIVYPDAPSCLYGLCVNVRDYPKEHIRKILDRAQFMNGFFEATEQAVVIDNRFNTDEMSLCETKVHTIYPEKANNTMKMEKVIVNVEGHKQGVVFETCVDTGHCKFSNNFPTGYKSQCKQKYIHKRLMVLGDNDKFVFDSFEVPSCCVCTLTRTD